LPICDVCHSWCHTSTCFSCLSALWTRSHSALLLHSLTGIRIICMPFFVGGVLGFELTASHLLGRHATTWAILPAVWGLMMDSSRQLVLNFAHPDST
jgi:hypothetical protein